jgi:hypothetical protein
MKSLKTILGIALSVGGLGTAATVTGVSIAQADKAVVDSVVEATYVPETIYLVPNAEWKTDGAWFAAYFKNGTWAKATDNNSDGIYEISNSGKSNQVIFCRMKKSATTTDWNNVWNQMPGGTDQWVDIPASGSDKYTLNAGWTDCGGTWSSLTSKTYYCFDPANTLGGTAYAHMWGGDSTGTTWPGTKMNAYNKEKHIYSISTSNDYKNIIFNNGSGTQTGDLTLDYEKPVYSYRIAKWISDVNDTLVNNGYYLRGVNGDWTRENQLPLSDNNETEKKITDLQINGGSNIKALGFNDGEVTWINPLKDNVESSDPTGHPVSINEGNVLVSNSGLYDIYVSVSGGLMGKYWFETRSAQDEAVEFAKHFNTTIGGICNIAGGYSGDLAGAWSTLAGNTAGNWGSLSEAAKALFTNNSGDSDISEAVAKYKYVYGKYATTLSLSNFMNNLGVAGSNTITMIPQTNNSVNASLIVVISTVVIVLTATGAFFILRKKKHN